MLAASTLAVARGPREELHLARTAMEHLLPATTAQWTMRKMLARGIAAERLFEGTRLDAAWVDATKSTLSFRDYERLVVNAIEATGNPSLGLSLGVEQQLPQMGIYGYAVMASATVDEAADVARRFWNVAGSLVRVRQSRGTVIESWELVAAFPMTEASVWRFAVEETLGAVKAGAHFLCEQPIPFDSIQVSYRQPAYADRYREVLGVDVRFSAEHSGFSFQRSYGVLPVASHNPEVSEVLQRQCQAALAGELSSDALVQSIHDVIVESSCRLTHLDEVAAALGVSGRTIQRRLLEGGHSFQGVRDDLRERLARSLLRDTRLSVEDVAHRLGFSAATNFRVAFKRWTGLTVQQYRRSTQ